MSLLQRLLFCAWLLSLSSLASATYTKVSNSGKALPESAPLGSGPNDWACTYESTTKLIWEVKTNHKGLRDQNWSYTNSPDGNKGNAIGGKSDLFNKAEIYHEARCGAQRN